jgi:hypothetical protein
LKHHSTNVGGRQHKLWHDCKALHLHVMSVCWHALPELYTYAATPKHALATVFDAASLNDNM